MALGSSVLQSSRGSTPTLLMVDGTVRREIAIDKYPFTIGRGEQNHLVLPHSSISREHACIVAEAGEFFVEDRGSRHGTFVNGAQVKRHRLEQNDRVEFGRGSTCHVIFQPQSPTTTTMSVLAGLSKLRKTTGPTSDLEQLNVFLDAVRRFGGFTAITEIFMTLVECSLRLTCAERGFLYLSEPDGGLKLAVGLNSTGQRLQDDGTISYSVLHEAATSASEFLVTDTQTDSDMAMRHSIAAHNLRMVVALPIRRRGAPLDAKGPAAIWGVLYLDSQVAAANFTKVSGDILRALASDAAGLLENASLAEAEQRARKLEQELTIAARIQRRLLAVTPPRCEFAKVSACSVACREVGGDFLDVTLLGDSLYFVLADVSGKGMSAALLASILHGIAHSQFLSGRPLLDIAEGMNAFLCEKAIEEKYATLLAGCLRKDGRLDLLNCGHLPPLLYRNGATEPEVVDCTGMPVGLFADAKFGACTLALSPGSRVYICSDGITEAESAAGEFFGDERTREVLSRGGTEELLAAVRTFCGTVPPGDDCSILEVRYNG